MEEEEEEFITSGNWRGKHNSMDLDLVIDMAGNGTAAQAGICGLASAVGLVEVGDGGVLSGVSSFGTATGRRGADHNETMTMDLTGAPPEKDAAAHVTASWTGPGRPAERSRLSTTPTGKASGDTACEAQA
jgi:hypothetical protein